MYFNQGSEKSTGRDIDEKSQVLPISGYKKLVVGVFRPHHYFELNKMIFDIIE